MLPLADKPDLRSMTVSELSALVETVTCRWLKLAPSSSRSRSSERFTLS